MIHRMRGPPRKKPFPKGMSPILDSIKGLSPAPEPILHLPKLERMLQEGDMTARMRACFGISELAKKRPEKARELFPALLEAFERWGPMTKAVIAETMVELQDPRALPALIGQLDTPVLELRKRIEWALSSIPALSITRIE